VEGEHAQFVGQVLIEAEGHEVGDGAEVQLCGVGIRITGIQGLDEGCQRAGRPANEAGG
jgi:hypothetical protein